MPISDQVDSETTDAVEQAELRKQLEEAVSEAQAHRAQSRGQLREEEREPPTALSQLPPGVGRRVLLRLVVFLLLVIAVYFLVREGSYRAFAPELEVIGMVLPGRNTASEAPVRLGVKVANRSRMQGHAFVVAVFRDGQTIEGPVIPIARRDTAFASVQVQLPAGEHTFTLIVFDLWRDSPRRLRTLHGVRIGLRRSSIGVDNVELPARVAQGSDVTVRFSVTNEGYNARTATPLILLRDESGREFRTAGATAHLAGGATSRLGLVLRGLDLSPGLYLVDVIVRTADGEEGGRTRYPVPLEITR